jgi:hypothetical protein
MVFHGAQEPVHCRLRHELSPLSLLARKPCKRKIHLRQASLLLIAQLKRRYMQEAGGRDDVQTADKLLPYSGQNAASLQGFALASLPGERNHACFQTPAKEGS